MNHYLKAAAALALSLPMMAFAEDCVPSIDNHQCPAGTPSSRWCMVRINAVSCPVTALMRTDPIPRTSAPDQSITYPTCEYTGGGYTCTAWPYNPEAGYTWGKFGNLSWVGSPSGDTVSVTCTPGMNNRINLKVSAPDDPSVFTTATEYLYCGAMGEY